MTTCSKCGRPDATNTKVDPVYVCWRSMGLQRGREICDTIAASRDMWLIQGAQKLTDALLEDIQETETKSAPYLEGIGEVDEARARLLACLYVKDAMLAVQIEHNYRGKHDHSSNVG